MKGKVKLRRYIAMIIVIILTAFFQSIGLAANIGVYFCDSISMNVYELTGFKVGYFSILMNCVLVFIQMLILRRRFRIFKILQVPVSVLFGLAVNFFYYQVLNFELPNYGIRFLLWGISIAGISVYCAVMNVIDLITTSPEAVSYTISTEFHVSYGKIRSGLDISCIVISLALSLAFGLSFKFREGTIGAMLLLGPLTGSLMPKVHPMLEKFDLCERGEKAS